VLQRFSVVPVFLALSLLAPGEDIPAALTADLSPPAGTAIKVPQVETAKPEPIHIALDGARKPGDCMQEGKAVQQELQTLHFPPGWKIAIVCSPVRWQILTQPMDTPHTPIAFTRPNQRLTALNGAIFHEFPPHYRHILAHELGHIQCNCADEALVEQLASKLEKNKGPRSEQMKPDRMADVTDASK
jgi:hypothetical protein